MLTTLTLTRSGNFEVKWTRNDSKQCGIRGTRKLFYRVEVTCPDTDLDQDGFMVDQLEIDAAIQARYTLLTDFVSCERLAIDCAKMVRNMVKNVIRVKVSIGAGKIAFMTCELN